MEKTGYLFLAVVAVIWLLAMLGGMIAAFPFGIIGLIAIVGIGLLFAKVVKDRMKNEEDTYYIKNVKK